MIDVNQEHGAPAIKGRIRMAYSLNGTQPVLCTLLCDQPLYYMEDDIIEEDDFSLFLEEEKMINAALGADLNPIQKKISVYDSIARKYERPRDARLHDFSDNAASFGAASSQATTPLSDLLAAFAQSRYGQSLLDQANAQKTAIVYSDQVRGSAYDAEANMILINPGQAAGDAYLHLTRALRLQTQELKGAGAHPLSYHPDAAILVNRAQAADLVAAQARAAWELQLADITDAWARLEQSQGCDLARAFAREALCDFRSLNNGKAALAVFESWFLSDRCKVEDRELIQAMLADQEARRYETPTHELNQTFLGALGEQTLGTNYLAAYAGTVLSDPIFSDVRDRSNANFLWFVKFERSFKQTEQEVLSGGEETIHNVNAGDKKSELSAILNLSDMTPDTSQWAHAERIALQTAPALEEAENSSNIVYVSFGSVH